LLQNEEGIQIVGEAGDWVQTLYGIRQWSPDVILVDAALPVIDEMRTVVENNQTKPLILTDDSDDEMILDCLRAGVRGYLNKNAKAVDLMKAIRTVNEGEMWVERKVVTKFVECHAARDKIDDEPATKEKVSSREREVLRLLSEGCTNKEIAEKLFLSEKTVKNHLNSIFKKLKVSRRLEAVLVALKKGLC